MTSDVNFLPFSKQYPLPGLRKTKKFTPKKREIANLDRQCAMPTHAGTTAYEVRLKTRLIADTLHPFKIGIILWFESLSVIT